MKRKLNWKLFLVLCLWLVPWQMSGQLRGKINELLGKADTMINAPSGTDSSVLTDTAYVHRLQRSLREAQTRENNLQMELNEMKIGVLARDSADRVLVMRQIDSLRRITKGYPVVLEKDTLFSFYTPRGGVTAQMRAETAQANILAVGKKLVMNPDSVHVEKTDIVSDIMYADQVLFSVTDRDALWENMSRDSLAQLRQQQVVQVLHQLKDDYGLWRQLKRVGYFLLVVVGQILLFMLTNWLFRKLQVRIDRLKDTHLKPIMIQTYELLNTDRQVRLLHVAANLLRYVVMLVQLLFSVPLIFIIFPKTEKLAFTLLGYLWTPIKSILKGVVDYVPNLFTIVIIWLCVHYLIRLLRYLAKEIEEGRLQIKGFYNDWALPTFHIVRFLLYAFMVAMIYPYLPGSNSGVFQGISVFVGLIVSLGSTTVIGNIIAGMVITYMRPFKLGDYIKLNDTSGNVIEKTPLVTRIRTPKNEIVTMPNSFMMSSQTINYSSSAQDYGLIIHSEVTIGYDAPWRQVHQLLIEAALATPGVTDEPRPFVLQTSLSDWYPVYQINAYVRNAQELPKIYSILHQNIQDRFNEAGVEIMSPHYMAMRDGNETTMPKNDQRDNPDYKNASVHLKQKPEEKAPKNEETGNTPENEEAKNAERTEKNQD